MGKHFFLGTARSLHCMYILYLCPHLDLNNADSKTRFFIPIDTRRSILRLDTYCKANILIAFAITTIL